VLTAKDDHTLVSTVPGAVLRVSLASNPGTGYSWQVTTRTAPVLSQLGPPRLVLRKTRAVGVPGTAVFSFKAAAPGTTRLGLSYVGPGTAAAVGRTFSVTVTVR